MAQRANLTYRGNLAYDAAPTVFPGQTGKSRQERRAKAAPEMSFENRRYYQEKAQYESRSSRRTKKIFQTFLAIVVISLMLAFVLNNQAKIVRQNFINADLQSKINALQIEKIQKQSDLVKMTNMDKIRSEAIKMGFKDPSQDQVIYLNIPKQDKLLLGREGLVNNQGSSPNGARDSAMYQNLEGFFKTLQP